MAGTAEAAHTREQPHEELYYAGFSLRIVAFILDFMVMASVFALFVAAGGIEILARSDWGDTDPSDGAVYAGVGIALSFFLLLPWYFTIMWWWKGQTLGKMAVHIAVADRSGHLPGFWQSLLRTVVFPLSFIPLMTGILTILFDRQYRALHDMIAGTVVVELP
jgi:uncharacterized RDD family membrane protein YckC